MYNEPFLNMINPRPPSYKKLYPTLSNYCFIPEMRSKSQSYFATNRAPCYGRIHRSLVTVLLRNETCPESAVGLHGANGFSRRKHCKSQQVNSLTLQWRNYTTMVNYTGQLHWGDTWFTGVNNAYKGWWALLVGGKESIASSWKDSVLTILAMLLLG